MEAPGKSPEEMPGIENPAMRVTDASHGLVSGGDEDEERIDHTEKRALAFPCFGLRPS